MRCYTESGVAVGDGIQCARTLVMRFRVLPLLLAAVPMAVMGCSPSAEDEDSAGDAVTNRVLDDIGQKLQGVKGSEVLTKNEDALAAKLGVIDSAQPGDTLDVSRGLDAARGPVDRDVFRRELDYYEIRVGARNGNAPGPR